jgi:omega-amidase
MNQNLKISLIQTDLAWENPAVNLKNFEEKISKDQTNPDLIVLPEMFNSGFSMNFFEAWPSFTLEWMREISRKKEAAIYGSLAIKDKDQSYNRGLFVKPAGELNLYDKKHLFKYGKEHEAYSSGSEIVTVEYKDWRIRPLICYDLRFPIWSRNTKPYYDLLIYIASWPMARIEAWKTLLKARAIENQCYVIGVNRIGQDGNNLNYNGQSMIVDYTGHTMEDAQNKDGVFSASLSMADLINFRAKFPFLADADSFELK